jgi:hypothetical protein
MIDDGRARLAGEVDEFVTLHTVTTETCDDLTGVAGAQLFARGPDRPVRELSDVHLLAEPSLDRHGNLRDHECGADCSSVRLARRRP